MIIIEEELQAGEIRKNPHIIYVIVGGEEVHGGNIIHVPIYPTDSRQWRSIVRAKFARIEAFLMNDKDVICYFSPVVKRREFPARLVRARFSNLFFKYEEGSSLRLVKW